MLQCDPLAVGFAPFSSEVIDCTTGGWWPLQNEHAEMDPLLKRIAILEARVDRAEGRDGGSLAAHAEALVAVQGQLAASEELMTAKMAQLETQLAHYKQDNLLSKSAAGADDTGALTHLVTSQTDRLDSLTQDLLTSRKSTATAMASMDAQNQALAQDLQREVDGLLQKLNSFMHSQSTSDIAECISRLNAMEEQSFEDMGVLEDRLSALEKITETGSGDADAGSISNLDKTERMIRLHEDMDLRVTHLEALLGSGADAGFATTKTVTSLQENIYLVEAELDDKIRALETQLLCTQGGSGWAELPPPQDTIDTMLQEWNLSKISKAVQGVRGQLESRMEEFAAQKQAQEGLWQMFAVFQEQHSQAPVLPAEDREPRPSAGGGSESGTASLDVGGSVPSKKKGMLRRMSLKGNKSDAVQYKSSNWAQHDRGTGALRPGRAEQTADSPTDRLQPTVRQRKHSIATMAF
eukprot:SAG31_NODE_34_length_31842_cov_31.677850_18_plen_466_part_00